VPVVTQEVCGRIRNKKPSSLLQSLPRDITPVVVVSQDTFGVYVQQHGLCSGAEHSVAFEI